MGSKRRYACGTAAGYQRHRYYKEDACMPCLDAHRNRFRLHREALKELRLRHEEEFNTIVNELKQKMP